MVQVFLDCLLQALYAGKRSPPNPLLGNFGKPALDLIDPGPAGRCEVQVVSRMACKPANHLRGLVGSVVIHHHMNLLGFRRELGVDQLHEFEELLVSMATMALADHFAGSNVQGGKQRRGAVSLVVAGPLLRQPGTQR